MSGAEPVVGVVGPHLERCRPGPPAARRGTSRRAAARRRAAHVGHRVRRQVELAVAPALAHERGVRRRGPAGRGTPSGLGWAVLGRARSRRSLYVARHPTATVAATGRPDRLTRMTGAGRTRRRAARRVRAAPAAVPPASRSTLRRRRRGSVAVHRASSRCAMLVGAGVMALVLRAVQRARARWPIGVLLAALPVGPLIACFLWLDRYEPEPRAAAGARVRLGRAGRHRGRAGPAGARPVRPRHRPTTGRPSIVAPITEEARQGAVRPAAAVVRAGT